MKWQWFTFMPPVFITDENNALVWGLKATYKMSE